MRTDLSLKTSVITQILKFCAICTVSYSKKSVIGAEWMFWFYLLKRIRIFNNENNKSKYTSSLTDKYLDDSIECDYCQMQSNTIKPAEDVQCEASHWFRNFVRKDYFPVGTLHKFRLRKHFSLKQTKLMSSLNAFPICQTSLFRRFRKIVKSDN